MRTQTRRKVTLLCLVALSVIVTAAASTHAQVEAESCDVDGVKVGFQGTVCGVGFFHVTLNGVIASGTNTKCKNEPGSNFEFTSSNKAFVKLKIDETYVVTSGTGICVNHINFDVPKCYALYIDGVESTAIVKTNGGFSGTGDGSWNVVLRRKFKCSEEGLGDSGSKAGSVVWEAGLGRLKDGRSAENIRVQEKLLSSTVYTPSALIYSPPSNTTEVEVIKNGNTLRQIKAPQALVDIVVVNSSEYDIKFYRPADITGQSGGVYTVTGQPYVTWKFKNPVPGTFTKLEIQKFENGTKTNQSEYLWDSFVDSWTVSTGWSPTTGQYSRKETILVSYPNQHSRTETFIVKEGDVNETVVSVIAKTYQTFPWGEELVQEVEDPDDAALTTTYTYYDNPHFSEEHKYQKLKSVTYPDGSWEIYDYDVFFNIHTIMRPWKDLSMASATAENSHLTIYGYTNSDNGVFGIAAFPKIDFDTEVKIAGATIHKTRLNRSIASVDPEPLIATAESSYKSSNDGEPVDLITETITTRYHHSASPFLANRVASIDHPDGRKDSFTYEKGNYVPNADPALSEFIPDANGLAQRETVVHGTSAAPNGVAFKTTKDVTVRDQFGNQVLQETYAYNGTTYERLNWSVSTFDDRGHVTMTRNHRGEVTTSIYNGDQIASEIDAAGVETTYEYDPLNRLKKTVKKGIAAGGGFPGQADIETSFTYDADGRETSDTVKSGTLELNKYRLYDKAGRVIRETNEAQLATTYLYTNGGRTKTITYPGGATEVSNTYLDGQSKSVTGASVVSQHFDYGVNADGTRWKQEFTGPAGLSSPRWSKTTLDWVDRTISVEKPGFTGTNVIQASFYNSLGQLQRQTTSANSVKLIGDTLYEYDELGRETRTGLDIDNSGTLTAVSTDRLTEKDSVYEKVGNDWFYVSFTKLYLVDNNNTPVTQWLRERLTNFPINGTEQTISEITMTDSAGNNKKQTTTVDRAAKKHVTTTDVAESNLNRVDIRINDLLQSSAPSTPQNATTYSYDQLGRQISITDSQAGTKSRIFNTLGQIATINDGTTTIDFEYYPSQHLNAGRLKSQTNAAGKKLYFSYNTRGQQLQGWGDAAYPTAYVYDSYGQRTEQHTFRAGHNWGASIWPATTTGTADVTKWIYQESTGLITQKLDAALKGPAYTYDALGRVKTRVWSRGITRTYGYDVNTGELRTVSYSDSTPGVTYTYDRGGRQTNISDGAGAHARTFNVEGQLQTSETTGGILDGVIVTVGYDGFLRRNSLQTSHSANTLTSQTYGYDPASRLDTITSGSQTLTSTYHAGSGLLNTTTFTGGTSIARTYDPQGRVQGFTTTPSSDTAQSYAYIYNNLNQRQRVTRHDGSYWLYLYNDRGEVVSSKKHWSDNSIVWGAQTEYSFDNIGNRSYARTGGNQLGKLRQSNYTANSLNQYSQRTVPGAVDVTGIANSAATVTVNNQVSNRKVDYFYKELSIDNTIAPVSAQIDIVGARNNFGPGGEDAVTQKGGRVVVRQAQETLGYDFDGNLVSDGRWLYGWDGENRLTSMEAVASLPDEAKQKLEFSYDHLGRRIQKKVYNWNSGTSSYQLQSTTKFVHDDWNVVAELNEGNALTRSYVWGYGELNLVTGGGNTYIVSSDGNKNVAVLVNGATGTIAALYDYDSFGENLEVTGDAADINPFRFSGKYQDNESGLNYYGLRYYSTQKGRWINRDPIEESGGLNLYAFVNNNAVDTTDLIGLCPQPKKVSISIDDGPLPANADMRALLRKHNITTTFFVVGRQVKAQEGDTKAIVRDGHGLANHTWSHPDLKTLSFEKVKEQLTKTEDEVKRVAERSMKPHWRPPYGNRNDTVVRATNSIGYSTMWLWDVDSLDWKYKGATQSIINQVKRDLRRCKKDECHMLFHDLPGTVTALGRIIPMLKEEKYEFVPFKK